MAMAMFAEMLGLQQNMQLKPESLSHTRVVSAFGA
jgi:hypothetical protein